MGRIALSKTKEAEENKIIVPYYPTQQGEKMMKLFKSDLAIQICLWGMFLGALVSTAWNGISLISTITTVGILLLAIDFPKKNKRNK